MSVLQASGQVLPAGVVLPNIQCSNSGVRRVLFVSLNLLPSGAMLYCGALFIKREQEHSPAPVLQLGLPIN